MLITTIIAHTNHAQKKATAQIAQIMIILEFMASVVLVVVSIHGHWPNWNFTK